MNCSQVFLYLIEECGLKMGDDEFKIIEVLISDCDNCSNNNCAQVKIRQIPHDNFATTSQFLLEILHHSSSS